MGGADPGRRLIVHNLPYFTTAVRLSEKFAVYGKVERVEIPEGKSWAFVEMSDDSEAGRALSELDGTVIEGL
ncbi:MAG: RNA-binding protein [Dehalococcoidia bacterium]